MILPQPAVLENRFQLRCLILGELPPAQQRFDLLIRQVARVLMPHPLQKNANQLLALLAEQKEVTAEAEATLVRMQQLNQDLAAEADRTQRALTSVDKLVALKDSVLAGSDGTREAAKVFATAQNLHDRLASSASTTAEAICVSEQLLAMEKSLRDSSAEVQTAHETLNQLLDMHDSLDRYSTDVTTARQRVDGLLTLKDTIIAETANLADAIETLELSYDLNNQYQNAAVAFEQMRHWMVEVIAMESILERAQDTLKPLTELGSLRHLTSAQLRTAAREISRGYQTQVAQKPQAIEDLDSTGASTAVIDSDGLTLTDSVDIE